jgi:hypothetical protein
MPIATPPDAITISEWIDDSGDQFRIFDGSSWRVPMTGDLERFNVVTRMTPDIRIDIRGVQFADGGMHRWVTVRDVPVELPAATAALFAEALAAANAEIERYR